MVQVGQFAGVPLDIGDFPTRHPYSLGLWQNHIERILAGWVEELPVTIHRGHEVAGFAQDDTGVDVELPTDCRCAPSISPGATADAAWSARRRDRLPGVGSDVEQPDRRGRAGGGAGVGRPPRRARNPCPRQGGVRDPRRRGGLRGERAGSGHVTEAHVGATTEPTLRDLSEALVAVYGTDYGVHSPRWISRHRRDPAGGRLPRQTGRPGRRCRTRTRTAPRVSRSASRMR